MEKVKDYLSHAKASVDLLDPVRLAGLIQILLGAYEEDRQIFVFGNGGSAANAAHFSHDLAKGTVSDFSHPKRFRILSLSDNVPFITALANDLGYETVFEQQLVTLGEAGDLAIAISGSGNSPNILRAVERANQIGMMTVGITGFDGGQLGKIAKYHVNVPVRDMCLAESLHLLIIHLCVTRLRERLEERARVTATAPSHRSRAKGSSR